MQIDEGDDETANSRLRWKNHVSVYEDAFKQRNNMNVKKKSLIKEEKKKKIPYPLISNLTNINTQELLRKEIEYNNKILSESLEPKKQENIVNSVIMSIFFMSKWLS